MLRFFLLLAGFILLIIQQFIIPVSYTTQLFIFLLGIVVIGIPHGAADLLVAAKNEDSSSKPFSKLRFFITYLGKLIIFGCIIRLAPLAGTTLFVLFSAYHFGETDLYFFKTDTLPGKLLVCSYGLVILSVILTTNIREITTLVRGVDASSSIHYAIVFIEKYKNAILSASLLFFFASIFFYFTSIKLNEGITDRFLLQFAILVFILYSLPLVLGFTFYFIVWHSVLSLQNIITYLRKGNGTAYSTIIKQILFFSIIALAGILISCLTGSMFMGNQPVTIYVFAGLAVLTAPHMHIMHAMYNKFRSIK